MLSLNRQERAVHTVILAFCFYAIMLCGNTWAQAPLPPGTSTGTPSGTIEPPTTPGGRPNLVPATKERGEDWSTPSLAGSKLVPLTPLVGEVDDSNPAFARELVRVQWRSGDPIDLYIIKPKISPIVVKNPPVVLYLYSYPFETDRFLKDDYCEKVTKDGFAAVGFVGALTGVRYRGRPMKEWFVSELQESLSTSAHDVQMILNYLATRGDLDMSRVGMFGDGSGATIAILAAAVDPRIKSLDLLDPWGDWPDWVAKSTRIPENERPDYEKPEWLAKVAPLDPVKWLPQLKTPSIRIQDVATVAVTPEDARKKMEASAPANAKIVRYDNLKAFMAANAGGTGFDWIKQQLRPGKAENAKSSPGEGMAK